MDKRLRPGIKTSKRNLFRRGGEITRDQTIATIAAHLKDELKKKKSFDQIPFSQEQEIQELLVYSLNKPEKSREDYYFIAHYLSSFELLMKMLSSKKSMAESKETLLALAKKMEFENHPIDKVICHHSDPGYKYYLILKGSIGIIIQIDVKVQMTYDDYYNHLINLKEKEQYVLLREILRKNHQLWDEFEMAKTLDLDEEKEKIHMEQKMNSNELISKADYCKLSQYTISPPDYKTLFPVTLVIYHNIVDSPAGKTFGDIALSSDNNKRTATVICAENCLLASLTKESYDKIVKDVQDKLRKANMGVILELPLFQGIKVLGFIKKYFNHFYEITMKKGNTLFLQGDERKELFFLKGGEIELEIYASFNDLTTLITINDGEIDVRKEKTMLQELSFNKINVPAKRKKNYKLFVYKEREIIGLDDLYYSKKYVATATCLSQTATLYAINYDTFQQIINEEARLTANYKQVIKLKKTMLNERLIKFRSRELESKYNLYSTERFCIIPNSTSLPNILLNPQITVDQIPDYKMKGKEKNNTKNSIDDDNKHKTQCNHSLSKEPISLIKSGQDKKKNLSLEFSNEQPKSNSREKDNCFSAKLIKSYNNLNTNKCFITNKNCETRLNVSPGKDETSNTKNTHGTIEDSPQKNIKLKKRKIKKSESCGVLDSQMISKDMLNRIIKISKRERQRSKDLVPIQRRAASLNCMEEELLSEPFYPSTIDFLAMDKVYESIELRKPTKGYQLRPSINPYNLAIAKRPRLPKIEKRSSLIFL